MACMPTTASGHSRRNQDFATKARRAVEKTIGERLDGTPLEDPNTGKNPHAVALGRLGAQKGGRARAARLSAARRSEIAKKAAAARWNKPQH